MPFRRRSLRGIRSKKHKGRLKLKKYIYIISVISLLVSFGCRSSTETANTTVNADANLPANQTVKTEPQIDVNAPFVPSENPKDDILASTKRLQASDLWSATLVNEAMPEMKTELEYVKPDRYRIKNSLSEVIVIGSNAYAKQNGKWQKLPEDIGAQIEEMKKMFDGEGMSAIKEVQKSGGGNVGGKEATVYKYSIEMGEKTVKNSTNIWIADDSGLPLKIIVETENGGKKQKVTTNYDYAKSVKIEAPEIK